MSSGSKGLGPTEVADDAEDATVDAFVALCDENIELDEEGVLLMLAVHIRNRSVWHSQISFGTCNHYDVYSNSSFPLEG